MLEASEFFPDRAEIEKRLIGLLDGNVTREEAADWACSFVAGNHPRVTDQAAWDALQTLSGVDGKHDDSEDYLYDKVGFRGWLEALRASPPKH